MQVRRIEKAWRPWLVIVVLEAIADERVCFKHFFGTKQFWVKKGNRVRLTIPKNWCVEIGDEITLKSLVLQHQTKFNWKWV